MTSNPNDVTSRLRRRLEAEREQIEETAASELRRLGESLSGAANDALRTIEADTALATGRLSAMLMRAWILPLVVGLSLFLGICGGSWATMHWLSTSIQRRIETLAAVNVRIEQARETLAEIEETTWGDAAQDRRGAVRGAAGRLAGLSALDRGRAACREAIEKVKELYDRVGTAVDGSLGEVVRAVRDGTAAALRAGRSLAAACRAAGCAERDLAAASRTALRASDMLGRGLQDPRRDVARALELMREPNRQRGPERDHGPSR